MEEYELEPDAVFGLLTDIQYCDSEDRVVGGHLRHYRNSLNIVKDAVEHWKQYESAVSDKNKFKFILNLGDIIDRRSKRAGNKDPAAQIYDVLEALPGPDSEGKPKVFHVWGNHECYSLSRDFLLESPLNTRLALKQSTDDFRANCFSYNITEKLMLIALDFYDYFVLDWSLQKAKNEMTSSQNDDLSFMEKLKNLALDQAISNIPTLVFNGGLRQNQLSWLNEKLSHCQKNNKKAIICGHTPLHKNAASPKHVPYNNKEILDLIETYENVCVAYFAGHYHGGGFHVDKESKITHITFPAVLQTSIGSPCFSTVKVFKDHLMVETNRHRVKICRIDI